MNLFLQNLVCHNLEPVTLEVVSAQCLGLAGPSGSGKTLFLRALSDLDPHGGEVFLDGTSMFDYKPHVWRKKVALLPSESQWWYDTVGEHFLDYDHELLGELGFDAAVMDWQISRLSTGEKQRLALLRLLANQPQVLLLDEPTANLDPRFVGQVESVLKFYQKSQNAALVWVSHDREQLYRVADRVFEIQDRCLKEAGDE